MARLEGWEARLAALIEDARGKPYVLGEHDCFRVACRVIEALTGVDRWPEFAGYRSRRQAMRKLARFGRSFVAAGDWFFGAPHLAPAHARRGDICALQTEDGEKHLGVCVGSSVACLAPDGLRFVETSLCLCCWRVG